MGIRRSAGKNKKNQRPTAAAAKQREQTLRKALGTSARPRTR